MEKIGFYQQIILELLEDFAAIPPSYPTTLRDEVVADTVRNHFQLVTIGWEGSNFVYDVLFHIDIIDGKIWIQQNNTEANLRAELVERGVPNADILVGFLQPPFQQREVLEMA